MLVQSPLPAFKLNKFSPVDFERNTNHHQLTEDTIDRFLKDLNPTKQSNIECKETSDLINQNISDEINSIEENIEICGINKLEYQQIKYQSEIALSADQSEVSFV